MLSDLEGGGAGLAMAPPAQPHYRVAALAYRVKAAPEKAEKEKEKIKPESIAEAKAPAAAASRSQDEAASAAAGEKSGLYGQPDEVKLTLSLSREERRVMVDVFSEGKDPDSLSGEERETLRSVSERIGK
ncbi:MAG: hypothetical protein LBV15_05440 [Planctomycetota bacterium]|jgi:hypothetical protein|nr:hypothetical protein [Planctomycetota bacterium]